MDVRLPAEARRTFQVPGPVRFVSQIGQATPVDPLGPARPLERPVRRLLPRLAGLLQPVPGLGRPRFPRPALLRGLPVVAPEPLLGIPLDPIIGPPADYVHQQGWVLTAFRNVLWQLSHAQNLEEAVVNTVMRGGDTDTNAAICGALLGAVYGRDAIPAQWTECLLSCRPAAGQQHVSRPRPECFWPVDAPELAEHLIS